MTKLAPKLHSHSTADAISSGGHGIKLRRHYRNAVQGYELAQRWRKDPRPLFGNFQTAQKNVHNICITPAFGVGHLPSRGCTAGTPECVTCA
jgi:hypothetical protein